MLLKNLLTLRRFRDRLDNLELFIDRVVEKIYVKIDQLIDSCKSNDESMVKRISLLETKVRFMTCASRTSGHTYTKWERKEISEWGMHLGIVVIGTCDNCLHEIKKYPARMKPAEKKKFIGMGILFAEDFPVKKAKK